MRLFHHISAFILHHLELALPCHLVKFRYKGLTFKLKVKIDLTKIFLSRGIRITQTCLTISKLRAHCGQSIRISDKQFKLNPAQNGVN